MNGQNAVFEAKIIFYIDKVDKKWYYNAKATKQDKLCVFRGKRKGRLVEALTFGGAKVPLASRAQEMARRVRPLPRYNELKFWVEPCLLHLKRRFCAVFEVLFCFLRKIHLQQT